MRTIQKIGISMLFISAMVNLLMEDYNEALIYSLLVIGFGICFGVDAIYRALSGGE
jgi:hypothetical protein